jgi:hypothetical protein
LQLSATIAFTPTSARIITTSTSITLAFTTSPGNTVYYTTTQPSGKTLGDDLDSIPSDAIEIPVNSETSTVELTDLTPNTEYTYYIIWAGLGQIKLNEI